MKWGKKTKLKKLLDFSEVFIEIIIYLLGFVIFINIIVSIFTFDFIEGLIRVGLNVGFYILLVGIIFVIKLMRKKFGIKSL
ncbi:MAG: hypothetical protein KQ78_00799 [Candidatus Izimaplasma bacterium HR2]|nr:MAG: hypothetical protein KQ78_00799 [Candidatus Izimaplasma bacterium HR2]